MKTKSFPIRSTRRYDVIVAGGGTTGIAAAIALGGYHLDIHSPDHGGTETERPPCYQIPYRCLVPREVDGLLVAGRCISATHEALSLTRVIPISMAQGQAAGTAAALAVRLGVEVRDVPIGELQAQLAQDGAILCLD